MFRKISFSKKKHDEGDSSGHRRRKSSDSRSPDFALVSVKENEAGSLPTLPPAPQRGLTTSSVSTITSQRKPNTADSGAVGLSVLYTPDNGHKVDIVFVHGLGGTSRWTWMKDHDTELFWPLTFLPLEPDICLARVMTFGYNSNLRKAGNVGVSILDFAKDLLFELKFAKDGTLGDLHIGQKPIVFVVHSMGGLIIKEAYLQGQHDPKYQHIIKAIISICFLATPHRGTNLAQTLNRVLQSTLINNSKQYITDLVSNSMTLTKLNEQFRHLAPKLEIVSFYETQRTSLARGASVMVLEKDSSVLGYPGEISKSLDADHHGVCKYSDRDDPNYVSVRNVLKSIVSKILATNNAGSSLPRQRRGSQDLRTLLAIEDMPNIDYIYFRDQWMPETNEWILTDPVFEAWVSDHTLDEQTRVRLLWLSGGAAAGKSVMSSFLINHLTELGRSCQYFFIRFNNSRRRNTSYVLRALAYQIGLAVPEILQNIVELSEEGVNFENSSSRVIWERLYSEIILVHKQSKPYYWIIDGLDESDDSKAILRIFSQFPFTATPIRILLVSRRTTNISAGFYNLPASLSPAAISIEGHSEDLLHYVEKELRPDVGNQDFRESTKTKLVDRAQNNFLWLRFAVADINACHRQTDIETVLQKLPPDMAEFYERMANDVHKITSPTNRILAVSIITIVTCAFRVLTVAELSQLLSKENGMLDVSRTVAELCGGFVVVDNEENVTLIHQTAREYLLDTEHVLLRVDTEAGNKKLLIGCLQTMMTIGLRGKIARNQKPVLLDYAIQAWSIHLLETSEERAILLLVEKFLGSNWVLSWVHALASTNNLRELIHTSKQLSKYASRLVALPVPLESPSEGQIVYREMLESWALDLVKLVGKFGAELRRNPDSIYKNIPPFTPHSSAIYELAGKAEARVLSVSGLSKQVWDDSLARMSFGSDYGSTITVAGAHIAVLTSSSDILLYESSTFEEHPMSPIRHGERVYLIALNKSGTFVASYGYRTTKVWDLATGKCITIPNHASKPIPLLLWFSTKRNRLLAGFSDSCIRSLSLRDADPLWSTLAEIQEGELEDRIINTPDNIAINYDENLAAFSYRNYPISAWEIDGPEHINHCFRARSEVALGEVSKLLWHPVDPVLFGLYMEGVIFKWSPYEQESAVEIYAGASRMTLNSSGSLLATGDTNGAIKVYTTTCFSLIHQHVSQDSVMSVAFSPGSSRLYDVRGYYANVTEPPALSKFMEQADKDTETDSETRSLVLSGSTMDIPAYRIDPITVLAGSPVGCKFCSGSERGSVVLHDAHTGIHQEIHVSKGFIGVDRMAWSLDGQILCFADKSKKVFFQHLGLDATPKLMMEVPKAIKIISTGQLLQIIFKADSSMLLIVTSSMLQILNVHTSTVSIVSKNLPVGCRWVLHPLSPDHLLGLELESIHIVDWQLQLVASYSYTVPGMQPVGGATCPISKRAGSIDRALVTKDKQYILLQAKIYDEDRFVEVFLYFNTSKLVPSITTEVDSCLPQTIVPQRVHQHISVRIAHILAFLSPNRLVFLSKQNLLCTVVLAPEILETGSMSQEDPAIAQDDRNRLETYLKDLFPLPGDWISRDCLAISSVWESEKSFLCPRNGEVAVVKAAALK